MKIKKILSLILTVILMVSILSIPISADSLSSAKALKPMQFVSINNTESGTQDYLFKVSVKSSCSLVFFYKSANVNSKSTLSLLNKSGSEVASQKITSIIDDGIWVDKKGAYYLKIVLQKGQSISEFGYYYFTDKADGTTLTMVRGEKSNINFINKITKNKMKWKSVDKSVAKVNSKGVVTAVGKGETRILGYSDKDEFIDIRLKVVNDIKKADTVLIAGNEYKTNVKELDLQGLTLTKSDMKKLAYFKNLETIYLMWCKIEDLSPIGKVTSLKDIGLGQSYVSDLSCFSTLVNLETASLECNEITDIKPLINCKKLESLNLMGNDINDYMPLKSLKNLKNLTLYNVNGIPKDQIAALKKALPNCNITS